MGLTTRGGAQGRGLARGALLPKCLGLCLHPGTGHPTSLTRPRYRPPVAVLADAAEQRPTVGKAADGKKAVSVAGAGPPPLSEVPRPPKGTEDVGRAPEQGQALPGVEVPEAQHAWGLGLGRGQQQAAPIQRQGRNLEEVVG